MKRHAIFSSLAICMLLAGCDSMTPEARAERLAPLLTAQIRSGVGGDLSGIEVADQHLGHIDVYVDRSLTIQPYDRSPESSFGRLMGLLDDFISSEVSFFGFGFPSRDGGAQVVQPLAAQEAYDSAMYTFANNDYASLFRTFRHDGGTRIVITDGVQSDPDGGARLSQVSSELNRWVTAGGTFAALLYRNPYRGQYYSDLPGEDPWYDCQDRPLIVFVLAPSSQAIDDLLARLGQSLRPEHIVRISGNDVAIRPIGETLPDSGQRRGLRVARGLGTQLVKGFNPIHQQIVVGRAGNGSAGFVPLQFEAVLSASDHPWKSLGPEGSARFVQQLRPEIHGWAIDDRRLAEPSPGDTAHPAPVVGVALDSRPPSISKPVVDGDSIRIRFTIPVRRPPAERNDFAFLVTLRPSEEGSLAMIPEAFSVNDDRPTNACGGSLKLRRLLGGIILRNYYPGRTLLLADWR
jgi:hypothetical protein